MHADFSESSCNCVPASQDDQYAQQIQSHILRTVDSAGVVSNTVQEVIAMAKEWLRTQPSHLVSDLHAERITHLIKPYSSTKISA